MPKHYWWDEEAAKIKKATGYSRAEIEAERRRIGAGSITGIMTKAKRDHMWEFFAPKKARRAR